MLLQHKSSYFVCHPLIISQWTWWYSFRIHLFSRICTAYFELVHFQFARDRQPRTNLHLDTQLWPTNDALGDLMRQLWILLGILRLRVLQLMRLLLLQQNQYHSHFSPTKTSWPREDLLDRRVAEFQDCHPWWPRVFHSLRLNLKYRTSFPVVDRVSKASCRRSDLDSSAYKLDWMLAFPLLIRDILAVKNFLQNWSYSTAAASHSASLPQFSVFRSRRNMQILRAKWWKFLWIWVLWSLLGRKAQQRPSQINELSQAEYLAAPRDHLSNEP